MSERVELHDEDLEMITGGDITYTWNGTSGRIGINGNNKYILVNKEAFVQYYDSVHGTMSDGKIMAYLLSHNIIQKDPNLT